MILYSLEWTKSTRCPSSCSNFCWRATSRSLSLRINRCMYFWIWWLIIFITWKESTAEIAFGKYVLEYSRKGPYISLTIYFTLARSPAGIWAKYGSVTSFLLLMTKSRGSPETKSWITRAYLHTLETSRWTSSTHITSVKSRLFISTYLSKVCRA